MAWITETADALLAVGAVVLIVSVPVLRGVVTAVYERYWIPDGLGPDELDAEFDSTPSTSSSVDRYTHEPVRVVCFRCSAENDPEFYFCRQCTERLTQRVMQ